MHKEAIKYYDLACVHLKETVGVSNLDAVDAFYSKSLSLISLGDINQADTLLKESKKIMQSIKNFTLYLELKTDENFVFCALEYDFYHYKNGLILSTMGTVNSMNRDYKQAHQNFGESVKILVKCLGEDHLEVADTYVKVVECHLKQVQEGKRSQISLQEVTGFADKALEIYRKKFDENHYKVTTALTYSLLLTETN